jgi:hypothetical protein
MTSRRHLQEHSRESATRRGCVIVLEAMPKVGLWLEVAGDPAAVLALLAIGQMESGDTRCPYRQLAVLIDVVGGITPANKPIAHVGIAARLPVREGHGLYVVRRSWTIAKRLYTRDQVMRIDQLDEGGMRRAAVLKRFLVA